MREVVCPRARARVSVGQTPQHACPSRMRPLTTTTHAATPTCGHDVGREGAKRRLGIRPAPTGHAAGRHHCSVDAVLLQVLHDSISILHHAGRDEALYCPLHLGREGVQGYNPQIKGQACNARQDPPPPAPAPAPLKEQRPSADAPAP